MKENNNLAQTRFGLGAIPAYLGVPLGYRGWREQRSQSRDDLLYKSKVLASISTRILPNWL